MLTRGKILIVEDEENIVHVLTSILCANNYSSIVAKTGEQALMLASSHLPDVILLDLGLPGIDGIEVLKKLREWYDKPVLVVSARDKEKEKVEADGVHVHLTQIEYKIVEFLARQSGSVMTYDVIMQYVWGPYLLNDNRILRVNMANIRRKLEINPAVPKYILTEIGIGYRMAEDEDL